MEAQNIKQVKEELSKTASELCLQNTETPGSSYDLRHCKTGAGMASTPMQLSSLEGAQKSTHKVEGGIPGTFVVNLKFLTITGGGKDFF